MKLRYMKPTGVGLSFTPDYDPDGIAECPRVVKWDFALPYFTDPELCWVAYA